MARLARKLRVVDYFTLGWGTMVGVGWLVVMDDWLGRGGPLGAVLGFAIGGALLLPIGYIYGQLVAAMPDAAGEIAYTAKVFPQPVSYATGWMMFLAYFIVCPWEAVALGRIAAFMMTLFIIAGSITFSQILAFTQASDGLSGLVANAGWPPMMVLLGMLGILLFLGCFMDQVSMMMITAPLFMPLAEKFGFDVVWFGVLMLMLLEIGLATPPFGLLLFVAKGAAPDTSMREIIVSVAPFIAIALGVVILLVAFPGLTLWLPRLMAA